MPLPGSSWKVFTVEPKKLYAFSRIRLPWPKGLVQCFCSHWRKSINTKERTLHLILAAGKFSFTRQICENTKEQPNRTFPWKIIITEILIIKSRQRTVSCFIIPSCGMLLLKSLQTFLFIPKYVHVHIIFIFSTAWCSILGTHSFLWQEISWEDRMGSVLCFYSFRMVERVLWDNVNRQKLCKFRINCFKLFEEQWLIIFSCKNFHPVW